MKLKEALPHKAAFNFERFIDIHTHILPGLDDGCRTIDDSIKAARALAGSGITTVVATPHFLPGTAWAAPKEKVLESVEQLQQTLDSLRIGLKVLPGMEIAFHRKLLHRIESDEVLSVGDSGHYLVEPPFHGNQAEFLEYVSVLLAAGHQIILAHPERIPGLISHIETVARLVERGLLVQVTADSLLGRFGASDRQAAFLLWDQHCCHFVASDMHSIDKRGPLNHDEWRILIGDHTTNKMLQYGNRNLERIFRRTEA